MPTTFTGTYNGALVASTVLQLVSLSRWNYIRVSNLGAATGTGPGEFADVVYVTTDGATNPAAGGDDGWTVAHGQTVIVPNKLPFWWQGFGGPGGNIDPIGLKNPSTDVNAPANSTNAPNPGTVIWILGAGSTTPAVVVEGAG
jgi:hypothetical protein